VVELSGENITPLSGADDVVAEALDAVSGAVLAGVSALAAVKASVAAAKRSRAFFNGVSLVL
jgi:hypothetical protein